MNTFRRGDFARLKDNFFSDEKIVEIVSVRGNFVLFKGRFTSLSIHHTQLIKLTPLEEFAIRCQ